VVSQAEPRVAVRPGAPEGPGWLGRLRLAVRFGLDDPDAILVGLAGFLVRGGILVLLAPSVVLPSVIGAAAATGVNAFGIDGRPTVWLFQVAGIIAAIAAIWLLLAFLIGSLVDIWLIEAALGGTGHAPGHARRLPDLKLLIDLAGVRAVCSLPLIAPIWWAGSRIYTVAYAELTAPTNLATPMLLRVVEGAAGGFIVVAIAWLATEVLGAIAVRRALLLGQGVWESLGGAAMQLVRRPLTSAATVVLTFGASVVATGFLVVATATAFDWCRAAARSPATAGLDFRPIVFILAAFVLGLVWVVSLVVSGLASAWRSAAFTEEAVAAVGRPEMRPEPDRLGLSGPGPERSGD
jgi:hypothetical protein